jgi:hypothetical protein
MFDAQRTGFLARAIQPAMLKLCRCSMRRVASMPASFHAGDCDCVLFLHALPSDSVVQAAIMAMF